jgi:hypothetical protein
MEGQTERFKVTTEDIQKYAWQDRINPNSDRGWLRSRYQFAAAAEEYREAKDDL